MKGGLEDFGSIRLGGGRARNEGFEGGSGLTGKIAKFRGEQIFCSKSLKININSKGRIVTKCDLN